MSEAAAAPGRPRDPDTDRAINAATRRLLTDIGYADLTIERVAKLAGVGRPTIYRRHDSKASLVASALREPLELANPAPPRTGDVRLDLHELIANLVSILGSTDFGTAIVEILAPAARDPQLADLFRTVVDERRTVIRSVLQRASDEGRLSVADVETAIDMTLGAIYYRHIFADGALDEAFIDEVVNATVRPEET